MLKASDITISFATPRGRLTAVDGISLEVEEGETVGIVGESGSGKSVSCLALMGLLPMPPASIDSGVAEFGGRDLLAMAPAELRAVRGREISMIFQNPMSALNPYMRIIDQVVEPLIVHEGMGKSDAYKRGVEALGDVGIPDPEKRARAYPHEFSGGMRQRVMIAMALITRPKLLIADEPTTALDVTVQKQVLDLIEERQEKLGTAVIFITHDLALASGFCDVINVMYAGRIVERAAADQLFHRPLHAYTEALTRSIPSTQSPGAELYSIPGVPPDLIDAPVGCRFAPRSGRDHDGADPALRPPFTEVDPDHFAEACPACCPSSQSS